VLVEAENEFLNFLNLALKSLLLRNHLLDELVLLLVQRNRLFFNLAERLLGRAVQNPLLFVVFLVIELVLELLENGVNLKCLGYFYLDLLQLVRDSGHELLYSCKVLDVRGFLLDFGVHLCK